MLQKNCGFALKLSDDASLLSSQRIQREEKVIPALKKGQVLVKVLASPVNPSDLVYLLGKYGLTAQEGKFCGFEGVGVVINANAGLYGKWLTGKRVALSADPEQDGLWAQYAITRANYCLPVNKDIPDDQAATLIVNPCTSVCLVERAIALGTKALLVNAAASQVGKGVIRYARLKGIKTIATVRSEQNVSIVESLGADHVLCTAHQGYDEKLKALCHQLKVKVLLDAVAAEETPRSLRAMPKGSTAIIYGRLTETHDPLGGLFSVADVIFRDIRIEGFWLATYIGKANPLHVLSLSRKVQRLFLSGVFKTDIYAKVDFEQFGQALDYYAEHKSEGKVILLPHGGNTVELGS
ncbi:zinc-binding dehydrogenase [Thalassotalea ganghwensis]